MVWLAMLCKLFFIKSLSEWLGDLGLYSTKCCQTTSRNFSSVSPENVCFGMLPVFSGGSEGGGQREHAPPPPIARGNLVQTCLAATDKTYGMHHFCLKSQFWGSMPQTPPRWRLQSLVSLRLTCRTTPLTLPGTCSRNCLSSVLNDCSFAPESGRGKYPQMHVINGNPPAGIIRVREKSLHVHVAIRFAGHAFCIPYTYISNHALFV